jgi:hypothetical protein
MPLERNGVYQDPESSNPSEIRQEIENKPSVNNSRKAFANTRLTELKRLVGEYSSDVNRFHANKHPQYLRV